MLLCEVRSFFKFSICLPYSYSLRIHSLRSSISFISFSSACGLFSLYWMKSLTKSYPNYINIINHEDNASCPPYTSSFWANSTGTQEESHGRWQKRLHRHRQGHCHHDKELHPRRGGRGIVGVWRRHQGGCEELSTT